MNYFTLYDMSAQFFVPQEYMLQKYYDLSKKYHPDLQQNANAEDIEKCMYMSAAVNEAKSIFKDVDKTIAYVLEMQGMIQNEKNQALPPTFLMEMMEYNERITQLVEDGEEQKATNLRKEIEALQHKIFSDIQSDLASYVSLEEEEQKKVVLKKARAYYWKKKYIARLLSRV